MNERLLKELDEAEKKAWDSLARYKFQMFGYWAAIWVHLNRISEAKRPNPWKSLVVVAKHMNGMIGSDLACHVMITKEFNAGEVALTDGKKMVKVVHIKVNDV